MWKENREWTRSLAEVLLWNVDLFKVKHLNTLIVDLIFTNTWIFTSKDINWQTEVLPWIIMMFLL